MDKNESSSDNSGIGSMLESIKTELKAGLEGIKAELKADLKQELDGIKVELKAELDRMKAREFSVHAPPPFMSPPHPADIPDVEVSDKESRRKTEELSIRDFSAIEVGGAFDVEIVRSDTYGVSITAEDDLFKNLDVSKEGDTLRIRHARHIGWRAQITRPKARIALPLLRELRLSGASRATINGFNSSEAFKLELSGASSVSGEITAGDAEIELSGASRAKLAGSAKDAVIEASGANHVDFSDFSVRNAAVKLSGASHVSLKIDGRLDARLSGVSHLGLIGNPVMGNIRTSGASRLSKE